MAGDKSIIERWETIGKEPFLAKATYKTQEEGMKGSTPMDS